MPDRPSMRSDFSRGASVQPPAAPVSIPTSARAKPKRFKHIGNRLKRRWWAVIAAVIILAGLSFLIAGYISTKHQLDAINGAGKGATEAQQLASQIGKTVDMPTDETPAIYTVNDVSKLKDQVFFSKAQNGDKVLFFSKAGMAVLYRPSAKKTIEYSRYSLVPATTSTKP